MPECETCTELFVPHWSKVDCDACMEHFWRNDGQTQNQLRAEREHAEDLYPDQEFNFPSYGA